MKGSLTQQEVFEAHYLLRDSPYLRSTSEIAREVLKNKVSPSAVAKAEVDLSERMATDDITAKRYREWLQSRRPDRLYNIAPNGSLVSDFEEVQSFINDTQVVRPKTLFQTLTDADRFYLYSRRKAPRDWMSDDLESYLETLRPEWRKTVKASIERLARHLGREA